MITQKLTQASEKTIQHLEKTFAGFQLWRASTWIVENVSVFVASWGMEQKMNQIANITIIDAQTIRIEPRDKKIISDIEKGIYDANLGFTPLNHGEHVLIKVPPLTQERRQELTKLVSQDGEEAKISIRNHRHDAIKEIKKQFENKDISETEKGMLEKQVDEITKEFNSKIEQLVQHKSEEVMKI